MNDAEVYAMELTLRREADELRRQRDEALQALRELRTNTQWHDVISASYVYQSCNSILAQYDKDGDA